jgi:hypothetical protein
MWTIDPKTFANWPPVHVVPTLIHRVEGESWGQPVDMGDKFAVESRVCGDKFGDGGDGGMHPELAVEGELVAAMPLDSTRALHRPPATAIVAPSRTRACGGSRERVQGRAEDFGQGG